MRHDGGAVRGGDGDASAAKSEPPAVSARSAEEILGELEMFGIRLGLESTRALLAAFDSIAAGGAAVSGIIGAGIVPAAVEMMDRLAIDAAEAAVQPNFPKTDTVLIVELDGPAAEVHETFAMVEEICRTAGASSVEVARTEEQPARIWRGRKAAFAAMGRVSNTCRTPGTFSAAPASKRRSLPSKTGQRAMTA